MKKLLILSIIASTLLSNDITNKDKKVFLDKYNIDTRKDFYKDSSIEKIGKIDIDFDQNKTKKYDTSQFNIDTKYKSSMANNIANNIKSKEYNNKIIDAKNNILYDKKGLNWSKYIPKKYQSHINTKTKEYQDKNTQKDIYIVISSSMPDDLIRTYFQYVEDLNINKETSFILRGAIGGHTKIMPTLKWMKELLSKKGNEKYDVVVDINPNITREWNISKVPAIIIPNLNRVIYGTIDLKYVLDKYNVKIGR
jgi:hypothetical protein